MPTANELLHDATVSHQVDLQHYSNGVVRRMIALLNRADPDLMAQVERAMERLPADSFTVQRLEALLGSVREVNAQAMAELDKALHDELKDLTAYEVGYQQQVLQSTIPVKLGIASVNVEQVYAASLSRPFQGKLLREVLSGLEESKAVLIRDAIRIGYVENQTTQQVVQRIRGTRALKYSDGLMQVSRRNAEAIVRTAISHTANYAKDAFYEANDDLVKALKWTATLDARTSPVCRSRDGKVYPVSSGPRPPAHWNCRSVMTPVLKSWREMGIDIDEISQGTRASLDGQVPADMTYQDWLKKQPVSRQDEILGKTKGKLFRDGGLELDRFVSRQGHEYNLDELRARDAAAFAKAGIE